LSRTSVPHRAFLLQIRDLDWKVQF